MENLGNKSIVLMGLKHCGKSTHGRLLAQKWGFSFFDTDEVMEQLCGMTVRALYEKNGVVDFMRVEEEACCKIMSENEGKTFVISTGGGICDNAPALNVLRACQRFVFLKVDLKVCIARIMDAITQPFPGIFKNVPSYVPEECTGSLESIRKFLTERFAERYARYENICDTIVEIKNAPVEENFKLLLGALS